MNYVNYLMKFVKITVLLSLIFCYPGDLYSLDNSSPRKAKLLIYDFVTANDSVNIKDNKKNYQFYSIIIPETVSKNLEKSGNYVILREKGPFSIGADFREEEQNTRYVKRLGELATQYSCDYIITGTFYVRNKRLVTLVTIFNAQSRQIDTVEDESYETGVQMKETPDELTQRITEMITNYNSKIREKHTEPVSVENRDIINYPSSGIATIGLDCGYLLFRGSYKSLYNSCFNLAPYIDFNLTDSFSLSFKYSSIQSDSDNKNTTDFYQIKISSSSASLCYIYRFTENTGISLSAGGGFSKTAVTINADEPFMGKSSEKVSKDPNIDVSSYLSCNISSVIFRTGVLYKRVFYKNKPADMGVIFAGAGFHF